LARTDDSPRVSVLLQTFNHERFIERAIVGVLEQDPPFPIELIVADDFSEDTTREIVQRYANAHPDRIRTLFPDEHLGMHPLFRRALAAVRGEYVTFLDGDDFWTSRVKLQKQVELLDSDSNLTGCFHDAVVIRDDDHTAAAHLYVRREGEKERYALEDLLRLCYPPTLSVVFRRDVLDEVPGWVFDLRWVDWLIWIFATRRGPFAYIDEALGVYRLHEAGYFSALDRSSQLEEDMRMYRRLLEELPEQRDVINRQLARRGSELAVEEHELPYDATVVVVEEPGELPLLFNGRTTRSVEPANLARLDEACRPAPPSEPFYRTRAAHKTGGSGTCYVLAPKLHGEHPGHLDALEGHVGPTGRLVWDDAYCVIYERPGAGADVRGRLELLGEFRAAVRELVPGIPRWSISASDAIATDCLLSLLDGPLHAVDVGTFMGVSAFFLAAHPNVARVASVDPNPTIADEFRGSPDELETLGIPEALVSEPRFQSLRLQDVAREALSRFPTQMDKIDLHVGVLGELPQEQMSDVEVIRLSGEGGTVPQVALIDGMHTEEGVRVDLSAVFDANRSCVAVLHDCWAEPHGPRVRAGALQFVAQRSDLRFRPFQVTESIGNLEIEPPNIGFVYPSESEHVILEAEQLTATLMAVLAPMLRGAGDRP
jgi:glycosyltransferase involved in cell wall biosynthesis